LLKRENNEIAAQIAEEIVSKGRVSPDLAKMEFMKAVDSLKYGHVQLFTINEVKKEAAGLLHYHRKIAVSRKVVVFYADGIGIDGSVLDIAWLREVKCFNNEVTIEGRRLQEGNFTLKLVSVDGPIFTKLASGFLRDLQRPSRTRSGRLT